MKKLSKFIIIVAVALTGCSKSFYDINTNPNNSTNASVDLVLANALKVTAAGNSTGGQIGNFTTFSEWMNFWAPSGSYAISSSDGASYKETNSSFDGLWQAIYHNLEDYHYVEVTATAANQYFYEAAAKTMKAYNFQQLVDLFNNVPYTNAFQGTTVIQPSYDNAQTVYETLASELDAAVVLFQRSDAIGSATQDVLFNGNNGNWIQFANTLKLRLLMRQTQMSGRSAYIQTQVNKILANGGGFLTTDAGVGTNGSFFSANSGLQSPFYAICINTAGTYIGDYWRACKYPIDFCMANNDPRYTRWYAPVGGNYVGCQVGNAHNPVGSASSVFGPGVLVSNSQPAWLITAAESYLLQAEAVVRGYMPGNAQTLFNAGVQASFTNLGAGSAAAYTAQAGNKQTNYGACVNQTEQIACIIRQAYLAFNTTTPIEAYDNYRRLGLPADLPMSMSPLIDVPPARIPLRALYPQSEYNSNAANVNAMGAIDYHASKIFWMP